jgi:hypothetical protein
MANFVHTPGTRYLVVEGVRRAKAAQIKGHTRIRAEVQTKDGNSLGECELAIDNLISPKAMIGRSRQVDEIRWLRAEEGASQERLPFPPIVVIRTKKTQPTISEVTFDFGDVT